MYLEDFNKVPDLPAADLALLKHAKEVLWPNGTAAEDATKSAETGGESANAPAIEQVSASPVSPSPTDDETRIVASKGSAPQDDTGRHRGVDSSVP